MLCGICIVVLVSKERSDDKRDAMIDGLKETIDAAMTKKQLHFAVAEDIVLW